MKDYSLLFFPLLCLGACCTHARTDPAAGGFYDGVCGIATGAYTARAEAKQQHADQLERINRRLEGIQAEQDKTLETLWHDIALKRKELDRLDKDLKKYHSLDAKKHSLYIEITALKKQREATEKDIIELQQQIDRLKTDGE